MKNIKTLLLTSLILSCSAAVFAADGGVTALPFLKTDMGARYYGMAGAGAAFADDVTGATFYNPAALGRIESVQLAGNTFKSAVDMDYTYAGLAVPVSFLSIFGNNPLSLGASVYMFDRGDMEDGLESRSAGKDTSAALTIGEHIGTNTWSLNGNSVDLDHYIGANFKYIRSTLPRPSEGDVTADVFAFDAGYQAIVDKHLGAGVSFRNMGSKVKYIRVKDPLPYTIDAGVFFMPVDLDNLSWTLSADYLSYVKEKEDRVRVGTEAVFFDMLAVRGGIKLMEEIQNEYTLGFGLKLFGFEVDFGTILNPQLNDDNVYQASISYKFPVKKADKPSKEFKKITDYQEYKNKEVAKAQEQAKKNDNPLLYQ